ncbi:MAG: hypothetical protein ACLGI5_00860 [Thermoleophilia bacterium]
MLAGGRIAIAAGLLAAPRLSLGMWIGRDAAAAGVAPVGRALGIRELVLGGMLLHTIDRPQAGPRWLRAVAACDAVDLVATVAARRALPAYSRPLIVAMAGAATAGQLWAAREIAAGEAQEQPDATA